MKTINNNYNLHIIPNNDFKTVTMKVIFWNKLKKEDLAYCNMLFSNLLFSSSNFPTNKDINIKRGDLYSLDLYYDIYRKGNILISEICLSTIHDKYSEPGNIKKSLEFLFECINSPNVKNESFDKTSFDICKESLKTDIKNELESPDFIGYKHFKEMLGKNCFSQSILGTLKDLDKITPKSLYKYYKQFLKYNNIDIFIIGDVDSDIIKNDISEMFNVKTSSISYIDPVIKYEKDYSEKVKTYPFTQSRLYLGANINNLSKHEKIYEISVYNIILGASPSSKLFQTVREKYSYCYSISSASNRLDSLFIIRAGISSLNYENTKTEVLKQIQSMKDKDFTKKSVEEAKKMILSIIDEINDSPYGIIDHYFNKEYFGVDSIEKQKEEIKKITKEDIVRVAKKINIDTIFLLKGDQDEKN